MSWDAVGAVGEILGAIAVFASLLYLARQIRQSHLTTRSQIESELGQRGFQAYDPIYEGRNAEIFHQGLTGPDRLEGSDAFVFNLLMHRHFGVMAEVALQIELGAIDPESDIVLGCRAHYRDVITHTPGGKAWLRQYAPARKVLTTIGIDYDNEIAAGA